MVNLLEAVDKIWKDNNATFRKSSKKWLNVIQAGEDAVGKARKQFHQWDPLRVYMSVGRSSAQDNVEFSLRFAGQKVAELFIKERSIVLKLKKGQSRINKQYFNGSVLPDGKYSWNGKEARAFRAYFKEKNLLHKGMPPVRSDEHRIESKFIQEMLKGSTKFGGVGLKIKPVMIAGCPLQFPVPISANTGAPKNTAGHIDILARRKISSGKVILSVWELKKPSEYKYAASQAYLYALALIKMIRSPQGDGWYKAFGFKSSVPRQLDIEAVVAITADKESEFCRERAEITASTPFDISGDRIRLQSVIYEEEPRAIKIIKTTLIS